LTPDDVRVLISHLQAEVRLADDAARVVTFDLPDREALTAAGVHPEAATQLLGAPWAAEMVSEVRETPEFCDPGDPPEQVLLYARDVVGEYIRKRFRL